MTKRVVAEVERGDLEENAQDQESDPEVVMVARGRDRAQENVEVGLTLAREETAGTDLEAERGGDLGREGRGRGGGAGAGEGGTEVKVGIEREIGHRWIHGI